MAGGWPHLVGPRASSLDAVEQACRAVEADPAVNSVGRGGRADRSGTVSLDASIMLAPNRCGAACCVQHFLHPVSIARVVMEHLPHVMLSGAGAEWLAALHGMTPEELLTVAARADWEAWAHEHPDQVLEPGRPVPPPLAAADRPGRVMEPCDEPGDESSPEPSHDTIGVLALDAAGTLAGACSTSGLAYKFPGRVGDSPIIGHGLYVDPRHGAAVATGNGELMMGVCATFLAVEMLRRGAAPLEAAVEVLQRIAESYQLEPNQQAALILLTPTGRWTAAALRPGYRTAVAHPGRRGSRPTAARPPGVSSY